MTRTAHVVAGDLPGRSRSAGTALPSSAFHPGPGGRLLPRLLPLMAINRATSPPRPREDPRGTLLAPTRDAPTSFALPRQRGLTPAKPAPASAPAWLLPPPSPCRGQGLGSQNKLGQGFAPLTESRPGARRGGRESGPFAPAMLCHLSSASSGASPSPGTGTGCTAASPRGLRTQNPTASG